MSTIPVKDLMRGGGAPPKRNNRQAEPAVPAQPAGPFNGPTPQEKPSAPEYAVAEPVIPEQPPLTEDHELETTSARPAQSVVKTSRKKRKAVQSKETVAKASESDDDFDYRGSMTLPDDLRFALKLRATANRSSINDVIIAALEKELKPELTIARSEEMRKYRERMSGRPV